MLVGGSDSCIAIWEGEENIFCHTLLFQLGTLLISECALRKEPFYQVEMHT